MTSPDPQPPTPRRLRRSATDRKVAGVAAGVAEHLGLDPALVRIAFGVLSLVAGIGLAAYAVAVFVIPDAEGAPPLSAGAKAAIVVIAIAAVISVPFAGAGATALIVPAAIGVLVWRAVGGRVDPRLVRASAIIVGLCGALAVGLGAGVATAFGGGTIVAALVIAAGAALVIGGLRGGARWLIVPALLLALPASVVSAADLRLEGGVGERVYRPVTAADLRPAYRLGAGRLRIDLRHTQFTPGTVVGLKVRVGAGQLELIVPQNVCVDTSGHIGAGESRLFAEVNDGIDVDVAQHLQAKPTGALIRLDARVGAGQLYVDSRAYHYDVDGFLPTAACAKTG
jgi:phage shock protein PspC (stress-responsive transcriptional regulator)